MDVDSFYHTPSMGKLMDPRSFRTGPDKIQPKLPYKDNPIGESPNALRSRGADVSGRVINVMTMLPHIIVRNEDSGELSLRTRRGLSAMLGAVQYLEKSTDWEVIHVAWQGEIESIGTRTGDYPFLTEPEKASIKENLNKLGSAQVEPVWLGPPYTNWREYAEHELWPTFHYMQNTDVEGLDKQTSGWEFYEKLNQAFCDTIVSIYQPGDIIWIHDYYLLLLPQMLRSCFSEARIGLYLHTPFPSSEFIRDIPQRNELITGMLGATLVGFQSDAYVRHFVSSCIRLIGNDHDGENIVVDGRIVSCQSLPIGIDTGHVIAETKSNSVRELVQELKRLYKGKRLIIGRDKFDSLDGVLQKLKAFSIFLEAYPEWREKVVLVQITTPAYDHNPKLEQKVAELVADINGTYGTMQSWPIQHYSRHIDQDEYFALLEVADVGFFTSVRDSTSHAALEYICCQRNVGGPVIVSEFMGLTSFITDALSVNPYDAMNVAQVIHEGLTQERNKDSYSMFNMLNEFNVKVWVRTFLGNLTVHDLQHESTHHTPELNVNQMRETYQKASQRLFLFDYDGTLTPIVQDPAAAIPSERLKRLMHRLCDDEKNEVWVISGRDQKFLDQWLGEFNLSMSAEHGSFVKKKDEQEWTDLVAQMDNSWKKIVVEVLQSYTERTQGAVIEAKKASITWHYRRADPVFGAFQASHLRAYLEVTVANSYPVDVMSGKANVEVRPHAFNKGEIVRTIFKESKKRPDFVLCMGDDTTDEDMFRAVSEQHNQEEYYTSVVGPSDKMTVAQWHVSNPHKVHDALESMID